jgi:hypothetical protein
VLAAIHGALRGPVKRSKNKQVVLHTQQRNQEKRLLPRTRTSTKSNDTTRREVADSILVSLGGDDNRLS